MKSALSRNRYWISCRLGRESALFPWGSSVLLLATWLALTSPAPAESIWAPDPDLILSLEGHHRFSLGDDPNWAKPSFDDTSWGMLRVPEGWDQQGLPRRPFIGWYRFHFVAPHELAEVEPALLVGPTGLAYEVYLNGLLVERVGRIHHYHMWGVEWREQIVPLPREHLRIGEDNLIAIRVQRLVGSGGINEGPVGIGDETEIRATRARQSLPVIAVESSFLAFYASTLFLSAMLWVLGLRDKKHFWFAAVILQIGVSHLLHSYLLDALWGTNYGIVIARVLLDQVFPWAMTMYCIHSLQGRLGRIGWVAIGVYTTLCIVWWWNIETKDLLYVPIYALSIVIFGSLGLTWCFNAIRRRHADAWPFTIGATASSLILSSLFIPAIHHANTPWGAEPRVLLAPVHWYAWLSLHLCMIYTLAADFVRTQRKLRKTSQGILAAHEEERRRISRELHDGVGQSMVALKIRLDMLDKMPPREEVVEADQTTKLVEEAASVIDELHRVSIDLHPMVLEQSGLVEAVRQFAADIQRRTGIGVEVLEEGAAIDGKHDDGHLYRIIQEAVNNAIRHGEAEDIRVSMIGRPDHRILEVCDNGRGFDPARTSSMGQGLGLASMQERAELLGGWLHVTSQPGHGTRVVLELPHDGNGGQQ